MSAQVDDRIVRMEFDNASFEKNVQTSLSTLDRLKNALNFRGAAKGMNQVGQAGKVASTSLDQIGSSVSALERRFSVMGIAGMRVVENLTDKAMAGFGKIASFTKQGIVQGGLNRAMNVEQAHFMLQGLLDSEKKVQAVMDQAKDSVDGTAYAFDAAAKAASMFTASGIKQGDQLEKTMASLADVTAATNSDYQSMADIFTTIAGNGRLMGDQLLQLSSRGMNAAAILSEYYKEVKCKRCEPGPSCRRRPPCGRTAPGCGAGPG